MGCGNTFYVLSVKRPFTLSDFGSESNVAVNIVNDVEKMFRLPI